MHNFQGAPNASSVDMEKRFRKRAIFDFAHLQRQHNTIIPKDILAWNLNAPGKDITGRAE